MCSYSSRLRAAGLAGLLGMVAVALLVVTPVAQAQSCPTPYATPPTRTGIASSISYPSSTPRMSPGWRRRGRARLGAASRRAWAGRSC